MNIDWERIFYVYSYTENGHDMPFYVGKGYANRMYGHFSPSNLIKRQTRFYCKLREILLRGDFPIIQKIKEDLTEKEAIELERELIKEYGLIHSGGLLHNERSGGGSIKSTLVYVDMRPVDIENLKQISANILKKDIKMNNSMSYNRKTMLRLVNHNPNVTRMYMQLLEDGMQIDQALEKLYYEEVHQSNLHERQYMSLHEETMPLHLTPDSYATKKIRELVNELGWESFITGLMHFADKKRIEQKMLASATRSLEWEKIRDRIATIRKSVQL